MNGFTEMGVRMRSTVLVGNRFALMFGGEAMQSLFGFGLSVAMARILSARDFGVFSIVVLMGGIALTYMRALAGVPAAMLLPQCRSAHQVSAKLTSFGIASVLVAACLGAVACLLLGLWLRGSEDTVLVAGWGAAHISFWSLRSFVRNIALIERRVGVTLAGDVTFTLSGTVLALLLAKVFGPSLAGVLAALAIASLCSIFVLLALQERWPRLSLRRPVVGRYLALWPGLGWSAAGVTITNLQAQGQAALVALIAGPAAYAPIAAGLTLMAPLRLAAAALVNLIQPGLSAAVHRSDAPVGRVLFWSTAVLGGLGVAYGAALLAILPVLQHKLFADRFDGEPMRLIVGLILAISVVFLLYAPPRTLLESLGAFRRLAEIAGLGVLVGLPAVAVSLLWGGAAWSLAGLLLSETVVLIASWFVVGTIMRRTRREVVHV